MRFGRVSRRIFLVCIVCIMVKRGRSFAWCGVVVGFGVCIRVPQNFD